MIRYREFAISAASLAGISLSSGCIGGGNINGDWVAKALVSYGSKFDLPLSFTGAVTEQGFWGDYTITSDFSTYTMNITMSVADGEATMKNELEKVYDYIYAYYGYDPVTYAVVRSREATYSGPVTRLDTRTFDIVMDLDSEDMVFTVDGEDYLGEEEEQDLPYSPAAVLECATNGDELHCDQDGSLLVFAQKD